MTVLITLVIPPGGDVDNFNLYSDTDGYSFPLATNISAAQLTAGYTTSAVPNGSTIIKAKSTGLCTNSINMTISLIPPTTTTTSSTSTSTTTTTTTSNVPITPCNGTGDSGGYQIFDQYVNLDPAGGTIVFLFNPQGIVDKLEIYHGLPQNGGINKKSTTSMTAVTNNNVFDNVWGTLPDNLLPNNISLPVDQFIGTTKGVCPTRQTQYNSDTGFTIPTMTIGTVTYQQVIWWKYTSTDFSTNPLATIRIVGGSTGTQWDSIRICP